MSTHKLLGGSSAHRWSKCTASVCVPVARETETSSAATEGTRLHEIAERRLINGVWPPGTSDDDRAFLEPYIDLCTGLVGPSSVHYVEYRTDVSTVSSLAGGTADFVAWDPASGTLSVVDLKTGWVEVGPQENDQLALYALGFIESEKVNPKRVVAYIVQPARDWDEAVKEYEFPLENLLEKAMVFQAAAAKINRGDAEFTAGSHCKYCPVLTVCPLLEEIQMKLLEANIQELTQDRLADLLEQAVPVQLRIDALHASAQSRAMAGNIPPRHKLVYGRGSKNWDNPVEVAKAAVKAGADLDEVYDYKLRTPADMKKHVAKNVFDVLSEHVVKSNGKLKLVHESEKGDPVPASEITFSSTVDSEA